MGGKGSTRWSGIPVRDVVERRVSINIFYLHRQGSLDPGTVGVLEDIGLNYLYPPREGRFILWWLAQRGPVIQEITLTWTSCNYGGRRPWFLCQCGRRVAILYNGGQYFLCRHCLSLSYTRNNENTCQQGLRRLRKLFKKMGYGWRCLLDPIPDKLPRMHTRTYNRLKNKYMWKALEHLMKK